MNNKDKIYMAGCGGMLGEAFYEVFEKDHHLKCTDINVNEKWLSRLDFRDYDDYKKDVKEFKPSIFLSGRYFRPKRTASFSFHRVIHCTSLPY